jgi:AcrR family transcriptional regulator
MASETGLRERKKAETRLAISHIATNLFVERGFDAVTVAEVAEAANVSKMTVFNYFPRKEDLFFDREDEQRQIFRDAIAKRPKGRSPFRALAELVRALAKAEHPLVRFDRRVSTFWKAVEDSSALRAHVFEMAEADERDMAEALASAVGKKRADAEDRLFAAMIGSVWKVAYVEALRRNRAGASSSAARQIFVKLAVRGYEMLLAAAKGTVYADR